MPNPFACFKRPNPRAQSNIHYLSVVAAAILNSQESVSHSVVSDSCDPVDCCRQAPLSMEFSSKSTGLGCHSSSRGSSPPRDRTRSPALQADCSPSEPLLSHLGSPNSQESDPNKRHRSQKRRDQNSTFLAYESRTGEGRLALFSSLWTDSVSNITRSSLSSSAFKVQTLKTVHPLESLEGDVGRERSLPASREDGRRRPVSPPSGSPSLYRWQPRRTFCVRSCSVFILIDFEQCSVWPTGNGSLFLHYKLLS